VGRGISGYILIRPSYYPDDLLAFLTQDQYWFTLCWRCYSWQLTGLTFYMLAIYVIAILVLAEAPRGKNSTAAGNSILRERCRPFCWLFNLHYWSIYAKIYHGQPEAAEWAARLCMYLCFYVFKSVMKQVDFKSHLS